MAVSMRIESNLPLVQRLFKAMQQMGANPQPLLQDIAFLGENSTRERFSNQTGPDGQRWKPSLRVQLNGGKTLTKDGHLGDSVSSRASSKVAEWGVNRIYAAIHQFGGKIDIAARSQQVYFRQDGRTGVVGNRFVKKRSSNFAQWATIGAYSIEMPERPFLGISAGDERDILALVSDHISNLVRRNAPGRA